MKKIVLLILVLSGGLLLAGCAAMIQNMCTSNAGYSAGINDAQNGVNMQQDYASMCRVGNRVEINRSYRGGYVYGMRHRKSEPPKPRPPGPHHQPWRHHHPHRYY